MARIQIRQEALLEMFIITIVAFLLWIIYGQFGKTRKIRKLSHLTSKYVAIPFLGHAYKFIWSAAARMEWLEKFGNEAIENGGIIGVWFGREYFTVICDAAVSETVLKSCHEKAEVLTLAHDLLGNGSVFAPVKIWRPRRKLLLPTFSLKNLRHFLPVFSRRSNDLIDRLKPMAGNGSFSIMKYLTYCSMESVFETILGEHIREDRDQFLNAFQTYCHFATKRMRNPLLHLSAIFRLQPSYKQYCQSIKVLRNFVDKIIESKRESAKVKFDSGTKNGGTPEHLKSFFDMLVDNSMVNGLSNDELREEILVLAFAGTDTSAIGSSFVCLMLSRYPDVQERLNDEIYSLFGECSGPITMEELSRLKYLDAVIKETLRLYPPVPTITRRFDKDIKLPSGIMLVEGTSAFFNIWSLHRNPRYWGSNADKFNPDRFLNGSTYHPNAFMPFSWGPRSCLGSQYASLSMKMTIINVVRNYKLLPPASSPINKPLNLTLDIMLRDMDGFQLQLERRHRKS